jgi:isoleucyl-tRNA synthetase
VHLGDYPVADASRRDTALESEMAAVMTVVRLGRQLRAEHELKVRQPLASLYVVSRNALVRGQVERYRDLIADELNVKEVVADHRETRLADLKAKANFQRLGPRLGKDMKRTAGDIAKLPATVIEAMLEGDSLSMGRTADGESLRITAEDLVVERTPKSGIVVASEGDIVVAVDEKLTPDLVREGLAREFVNKVQNLRKDSDLNVTQRIRVVFGSDPDVVAAIQAHRDYVSGETLSVAVEGGDVSPEGGTTWDLNGHACTIRITPVS